MISKWLSTKEKYDGSQLKPLNNYLVHKMLGDSVISWRGPCEVSLEHMKDGEDLLAQAEIRGDDMVHFIFEIFDVSLFSGVAFQRLVADLAKAAVLEMCKHSISLIRSGDDIYWMPDHKKLSISIAIPSLNSTLIHFAVNATNEGTPVPTAALSDFGIDPQKFAFKVMEVAQRELNSIKEATWKVRP